MKKRGKKAVSPVVSTALLIVVVIILAIIIFLWARGWVGEAVEKEIGGVKKTVDKFCAEVNFRAYISNGELYIVNRGNIPIYEINVKKTSAGTSRISNYTIDLDAGSTSEPISLAEVGLDVSYDNATIIPVLLGKAGNAKTKFTCPESEEVGL